MADFFNKGLEKIINGSIDVTTDTIEVLLVASGYTFDKANHEFVNDITNEVTNATGTGYERKTLANVVVSETGGVIKIDADDPTYTDIDTNEDIAAAIFYKLVTDDTDSPVISYNEGSALSTNGSDVILTIDSGGVGDITN